MGAQLAHALETDARLERERHDLLEVCCRQEQYWRLCCTRPKESIATDACEHAPVHVDGLALGHELMIVATSR